MRATEDREGHGMTADARGEERKDVVAVRERREAEVHGRMRLARR